MDLQDLYKVFITIIKAQETLAYSNSSMHKTNQHNLMV